MEHMRARGRFFSVIFPLLACLFVLLGRADAVAQESGVWIAGHWGACWVLPVPEGEDPARYKVGGSVELRENGTGEITIHGEEGSVLATEEATNSIRWTLDQGVLSIASGAEQSGIQYTVVEKKKNFVRLVLVEDIVLLLTRME